MGLLNDDVLDSLDMFGLARAFPEQVAASVDAASVAGLPPATRSTT